MPLRSRANDYAAGTQAASDRRPGLAPILEIAAEALNVDAADLGQPMLVLPAPDGELGKSKA